jgi:hypothetical protein
MFEYSDREMFSGELGFGTVSARCDQTSTAAGNFTLRRANYFSKSGTPALSAEQQNESGILSMNAIPVNKVKG